MDQSSDPKERNPAVISFEVERPPMASRPHLLTSKIETLNTKKIQCYLQGVIFLASDAHSCNWFSLHTYCILDIMLDSTPS